MFDLVGTPAERFLDTAVQKVEQGIFSLFLIIFFYVI